MAGDPVMHASGGRAGAAGGTPAHPPYLKATGGEDTDAAAAMPHKTLGPAAPAAPEQGRKTCEGTKQARIIAMLGRPEGASIAEIAEATGWLHHTIRGMIAGAIRKKLGLVIISTKEDERGRIYRLD